MSQRGSTASRNGWKMASKKEIAEILGMLSAAYPNFNMTEASARVYYSMLEDIEGNLLKASAVQCVRTSKWFPSVSELVQGSYELITDSQQTAEEAWGRVIKRASKPESIYHDGVRYKPKPLDELTEKAVEAIGGWQAIRQSEMIASERKRFIDAYNGISQRVRREITEHPLVKAGREQAKLEARKLLKGE